MLRLFANTISTLLFWCGYIYQQMRFLYTSLLQSNMNRLVINDDATCLYCIYIMQCIQVYSILVKCYKCFSFIGLRRWPLYKGLCLCTPEGKAPDPHIGSRSRSRHISSSSALPDWTIHIPLILQRFSNWFSEKNLAKTTRKKVLVIGCDNQWIEYSKP